MRDENRSIRQDQIEQAAYAVLEEKGFGGTSMLAIARAAKASNETLYNWYGDKTGLFSALVRRNAAEVKALLQDQIAAGGDTAETLARVGPVLLQLVTSDRAVALNRARRCRSDGRSGPRHRCRGARGRGAADRAGDRAGQGTGAACL